MFGRASLISLLDVLANGLAAMLVLWVTMMALGHEAAPPASRGRAFRVRVSLEDPSAIASLVVIPPHVGGGSPTCEGQPCVHLPGPDDVDGMIANCGIANGTEQSCLLFGWSLGGERRMRACPAGACVDSSAELAASFPAPQEGEWWVGIRYASRAGPAGSWPIAEAARPGTLRVPPMRILDASLIYGDVDVCEGIDGALVRIGDIAWCRPFRVER